jgi:hypothetical protein
LKLASQPGLSLELLQPGQLISILNFVLDHLFLVLLSGQLGLSLVGLLF